jgi:hypothetical protein
MYTVDSNFIIDVMQQVSQLIQELHLILEFIFGFQIAFYFAERLMKLFKYI